MKYFLTVIWGAVCIGVLVYGQFHWNQQTAVQAVKPAIVEEEATNIEPYLEMAANWPAEAKAQFQRALEEEKPYKILFVGSSAMEWEQQVTQRLVESYGSERITTANHTYDMTTTELLAEGKQTELAAEKAQLVVMEPLLLNDNGKVKIDVTLANLSRMIEDIKKENPDSTIILQPSYPIYLPKYYSEQVAALKEYAEENNLTYLDHWTAWPATDNVEIKDYLAEGQNGPNEKGNQVWGEFLVEYFIKK
jgi:lysophospholipase L1-like esterase